MATKTNVNVTLDKDVIHMIDMDRGQQPRSSFINSVLAKFFKKNLGVFDWGKEDQLAAQDIKSGNIKKFSDKNKAMKWLKS